MTVAVSLRNVSFQIGMRSILSGITLDIQEGESLGIIGKNGAGKTTLLKCLMRIHHGVSGEIKIHGRPLADYSQKELARTMSYVPQADGRTLCYTVREFVAMGRYPYLSPFSSITKEDRKIVDEAMERADVRALARQRLDTLSGGERQSVFIAASLAQQPKILLLDEPTTFLDPGHQVHTSELLGALNRDLGLTTISVTHDVNGAALGNNRVVAIKDGTLVFSGSGRELMCNEVLEKIYDISFVFAPHPLTGFPCVVPRGTL